MALRTALIIAAAVFTASIIAAVLFGADAVDTDIGYDLLVKSAGPDVNRTCFKIPALPASVTAAHGAFIISGPAKFEMGGYKFKSFFDGYGRINKFELREGEVCYTAKFMKTMYLDGAESLGRISNGPSFYGVEPPLPPCPKTNPLCALTGAMVDNNWVNILPIKGEGLMLTDSPIFVRLDYETLEVKWGNYPWKDAWPFTFHMMPGFLDSLHMPATGSAHPLLRPGTESMYVEVMSELPMTPWGFTKVAVYNIDTSSMKRSIIAHVNVSGAPHYLHSFGVTKNYVVLPLNLVMGKPNSTVMLGAFKPNWEGIKVVDLQGNVQTFETEPFFYVHIANSFENETGIVMDIGTFKTVPFCVHALSTAIFSDKAARDVKSMAQNVERVHMHLTGPLKGQVTREILSPLGRQTDFFKVNDKFSGVDYCIYYAVEWFHDDKAYASMAILKHNVCKNERTYWTKEHSYPGEPFFISTGDVEDAGLIVFTTLDGPRGASDFVILDAQTFKEIAVVQLPVHIPFTGHGQFIPNAAKAAVKEALGQESKVAAAIDAFVI